MSRPAHTKVGEFGYKLVDHYRSALGLEKKVYANDRGDVIRETVQDVDPILKANRERANAYDGSRAGDHMVKAASVPMNVYLQWLDEGVDMLDPNCEAEVNRRLNSPEWAYLKTDPRVL